MLQFFCICENLFYKLLKMEDLTKQSINNVTNSSRKDLDFPMKYLINPVFNSNYNQEKFIH